MRETRLCWRVSDKAQVKLAESGKLTVQVIECASMSSDTFIQETISNVHSSAITISEELYIMLYAGSVGVYADDRVTPR
jgi:hypothetical protein